MGFGRWGIQYQFAKADGGNLVCEDGAHRKESKEFDAWFHLASIGKKISKKAVVRNKIKRRVREAFMPYLEKKRGSSVVIFPRMQAIDADFETLKKEAQTCLEKLQSS